MVQITERAPLAVHKFCSTLPAFEMQARRVIAVEDAVRVELEAIAWRDGLNESAALDQRWLCSSELGSKIEVTCCPARLGKPPP